jgi:hypothetical protein
MLRLVAIRLSGASRPYAAPEFEKPSPRVAEGTLGRIFLRRKQRCLSAPEGEAPFRSCGSRLRFSSRGSSDLGRVCKMNDWLAAAMAAHPFALHRTRRATMVEGAVVGRSQQAARVTMGRKRRLCRATDLSLSGQQRPTETNRDQQRQEQRSSCCSLSCRQF